MIMQPLRKRLEIEQKKHHLCLDTLQQDYVLSWVLAGLFHQPLLKAELVFKGGTALKKCYFGDYRFSEDLDFSVPAYFPRGDLLLNSLDKACVYAQQKMSEYAPVRLLLERYEERDPNPHEQEAFKVRAQFPWQREALTVVMIEISRDETLLFPPVIKELLHGYGEPMNVQIPTYALEEIVLEKLRAILQHTKKLHERDWSRSRARDYYDLWRIFGSFESNLVLGNLVSALQKKCAPKEITFHGVDAFFDPLMIDHISRTWQRWLGPLVPQLPACETVIEELRNKLELLFEQSFAVLSL